MLMTSLGMKSIGTHLILNLGESYNIAATNECKA